MTLPYLSEGGLLNVVGPMRGVPPNSCQGTGVNFLLNKEL
jgi:hypothetical protein